jgi:hypothetical protein
MEEAVETVGIKGVEGTEGTEGLNAREGREEINGGGTKLDELTKYDGIELLFSSLTS